MIPADCAMTDLIGFHPPLVRKGIFKGVNHRTLSILSPVYGR